MTKLRLKSIVLELWTAYLETADPRLRAEYGRTYCEVKAAYLRMHGEYGDSEV